MADNQLASDKKVVVPFYHLPRGIVVLDGDIFKLFNYSIIRIFRKKLIETELVKENFYFFRLNNFEKYAIKAQDPSVIWLNTSAQAYAFDAKGISDGVHSNLLFLR